MKEQEYLTTSISFSEEKHEEHKDLIKKLESELWFQVANYNYGGIRTVIFKRKMA